MRLFLSLLLLWSFSAQADVDIFAGRTTWTSSDNGTWWQTPFPHEFSSSAASWSIGMSDELSDKWRWNAGYSNLGTVHSYGQAVGDGVWASTNYCNNPCPTPDDWYGRGNVDGVYLTISPQFKWIKTIYSLELGVWNYQPESIVYVPLQTAVSPARQQAYFITSSDRMWGQVFGMGIQYDNLMLRYRAYWVDSSDKDYPAIFQGYTNEIAIGVKF